jgi:hypothetical protein
MFLDPVIALHLSDSARQPAAKPRKSRPGTDMGVPSVDVVDLCSDKADIGYSTDELVCQELVQVEVARRRVSWRTLGCRIKVTAEVTHRGGCLHQVHAPRRVG